MLYCQIVREPEDAPALFVPNKEFRPLRRATRQPFEKGSWTRPNFKGMGYGTWNARGGVVVPPPCLSIPRPSRCPPWEPPDKETTNSAYCYIHPGGRWKPPERHTRWHWMWWDTVSLPARYGPLRLSVRRRPGMMRTGAMGYLQPSRAAIAPLEGCRYPRPYHALRASSGRSIYFSFSV